MSIDYRYKVMVIYMFGLFMTVIDSTMVNVALPTLARDFHVESTDIEWIAVGYLLALAAVIPAAGWLGDRFGTKRVFISALIVFVTMSLLCGLATSLNELVAFRIVQGVGGGLLPPIGGAMLYRAFPMAERAKASIAVLSVTVVAPAVGPLLGGVLVDKVSWRWIFFINGPIGVAALIASFVWLTETRHVSPGKFDVAGFVLSSGSVSVLLYTLSIGPDAGWASAKTIGFGTVGVVAFIALILVETHIAEPILTLRLFKDRLFRAVNVSAALIYAGFFGLIFVLPLYLQTLRGYSAFQSGLAQAPQAVGIFVISNLVGQRLYRLIGPRWLMVVGTAATAVVTCMFALVSLETHLYQIAELSFARGLAIGLVFVSIQTAAYATTSLEDTGRATSLFNTQRQIAYAAGVAIAATVMAQKLSGIGDTGPAIERLGAYQAGFLACGLILAPAAIVSWFIHDEDAAETRGLVPAAAAGVDA